MTTTHVFAFALAALLGTGTGFAQAPAPAPAPPSPPRARLSPAEAAERATRALERSRIDRDRSAGDFARLQDALERTRDLQIVIPPVPPVPSDLHIDIPDVHIDLADLEHQLHDLDIQLRDWQFDFPHDVDLNWNFDFDVAELARQGREMALQLPQPAPPAPPVRPFVFENSRSPEGLYDQARGYIDRDQYDRALQSLDRLILMKGARADAAMYWKGYSLSKLGRNPEALTTLAELRKQYPNSSWIRDVGFLELEIRQASGQSVNADAQVSEDIRLLALQGIMRSDPATAIPVVEKTLAGNSSIRVKERALFVLSQSREARAREVIIGVAKGSSNPDLKVAAIRYLGRTSGADVSQMLEEIYRGTSDVDVKRAALQALSTAKASDRLGTIARSEKDADLRRAAIRYLGASNTPEAADALRAMYAADASADSRRGVIDALASNRNGAPALVTLARSEKDAEMRREIVRRLSNMRAPEAQSYMMELLSK
jgi:tetratricopeptide (TPR) repeat protein